MSYKEHRILQIRIYTIESGTVASWDFIIDNSTDIDVVGSSFSNGEYRGNPPPPIPDPILVNLVAIVVVVIVIGFGYRRYLRNAT